jgi:hypothetical protein
MVGRYIRARAQGWGSFILSRGWVVHAKVISNVKIEFFLLHFLSHDWVTPSIILALGDDP